MIYAKDKYNNIASFYKYLNAGTIIGFSKSLYKMAVDCINFFEKSASYDRGNDQGIFGKYVYENIDKTNFVKLDTNCKLFWVTSGDNNILQKSYTYNSNTKTAPPILHIIGANRESKELFNKIYNKIMLN